MDFEEDGSGAGGYAKEMSPEWFEAADKMLLKEMEKTNVIITTALIPGRKAPVLIKKHHTDAMPHGSVIVDLAAETGGNCEITQANKVIDVNGVTAIGYTNMPSRLSTTSSTLYGNNVTKYLLSMSKDDEYVVDLENDEAVRSMCIVHKGKKLEEYVPPPPEVDPAAEAKAAAAAEEEECAHTAKTKEEEEEEEEEDENAGRARRGFRERPAFLAGVHQQDSHWGSRRIDGREERKSVEIAGSAFEKRAETITDGGQ